MTATSLSKENEASKTIGFILRANRQIGTGHLMRVNNLLDYLKPFAKLRLYVYAFDEALTPMCKKYDEVLRFATKDDVLSFIESASHKDESKAASSLISLSFNNKAKDLVNGNLCNTEASKDTDSSNDSDASKSLILTEPSAIRQHVQQVMDIPRVFVLDDYAIDESFESVLYALSKVFVIDDLYDRRHQCHMLLDQTLDLPHDKYVDLCNKDCEFLIGAKYSLSAERFYPRFFKAHESMCNCKGHLNAYTARAFFHNAEPKEPKTCLFHDSVSCPLPRVLVSYGGADPVSACLTLTKTIIEGKLYEAYRFTMLSGATNNDYDAILKLVEENIPAKYQENFTLLKHCNDVADLLFKNEIAMGAYGGMFRERIATGIPTISTVIADNQRGFDKLFEKLNLGYNLELSKLSNVEEVKKALVTTLERADEFTHNSLNIYDGLGLKRISNAIFRLLKDA